MVQHDRCATRGQVNACGLYVVVHDSELDNAHAHAPFDRLTLAQRSDAAGPARDFGAYSVTFDGRPHAVWPSFEAATGVRLTQRC
jgi:CRISPR-associated protein Csd2